MVYISLPEEKNRPLAFYLAMEEYVARYVDEDECFFMWQTDPTVIFGRNQLIENEVNLAYCREHGIRMFRRKSGGGCVYSDRGNVMMSYVTRNESVNLTFNRYINMVVLMLWRMGIEAKATGRNDIMIDDRKVSGNAFYHLPGRSIVHGTMLFDTDMRHMVGSITPSDEKLVSKGVKSVRQHVALLKDYTDISIGTFMERCRHELCEREVMLTAADVARIEEMTEEYLSETFIFGHNPRYSVSRRGRIEGVGDFDIRLELKNGIIKDADMKGDFFLVGDIGSMLKRLRGKAFNRETVAAALPDRLDDVVMNLRKDDLLELLFK